MRNASRVLAAKTIIAAAMAVGAMASTPAHAGIPVIDATNLSQNIMTAVESVAQTLKQIQQYQTQLQEYENMLQNTAAPAAYIWDQATSTMNGLRSAIDTLSYYKRTLGSVDAYTSKFQDASFYRGSPCFRTNGAVSTSCACPLPRAGGAGLIGAGAHLIGSGGLLRLSVGSRLRLCRQQVLLRDKQSSNLQKLVRLLAGEHACVLERLHLPGG